MASHFYTNAETAEVPETQGVGYYSIGGETAGWGCDCNKSCTTDISSCAEAYYQYDHCGCGNLDADNDGVPCEKLCE